MGESTCAVCGGPAEFHNAVAGPLDVNYFVKCPVCGDYEIADKVVKILRREPPQNGYILSGLIRRAKEDNLDPPVVTASNYELLMSESRLPSGGVLAKLDLIVLYLAHHSDRFGALIRIDDERDYPLVFAKDAGEFQELLIALQKMHLVKGGLSMAGPSEWSLTVDGWQKAEQLRQSPAGKGDQCFVAMWFSKTEGPVDMDVAFDRGFWLAIDAAGYKPYRVDKAEHNNKIDDEIIAEIRRSRLMVADFTGDRGGVYFEAGFAMGLGIPVIWTCHKDWFGRVHFDTNHYNHIVWETVEDLRKKLENRIKATHPLRPVGGGGKGIEGGAGAGGTDSRGEQ